MGGSGNAAALYVLRAMAKEPETVDAFFAEAGLAAGADARLDAAVRDVMGKASRPGAKAPRC